MAATKKTVKPIAKKVTEAPVEEKLQEEVVVPEIPAITLADIEEEVLDEEDFGEEKGEEEMLDEESTPEETPEPEPEKVEVPSAPVITVQEKSKLVKIKPRYNHRCAIGGTTYDLKKGEVVSVPENVKNVLTKADLLSPL